jgi:hypothetical protein
MVGALASIPERIWGGRTPEEILSGRFKIFVIIGVLLVGVSKLLYLSGLTFPNLELVIPTLVVVGSFSPIAGRTKFWRRVTRYFGAIALVSVFLADLIVWGFRPIYLFTWSGFLFAWLIGMRNKLSMFDKFKTLLGSTILTTAIAILIFDFWTGVVGWSLIHAPFWISLIGQIPFTFYHLSSLVFVPPLVGLGKLIARVKVPVPSAVRVKKEVGTKERR